MKFIILILLFPLTLFAQAITVLEIDTGIDLSHKEIREHVNSNYSSFDFTDINGHGTHVAGIILKDTCQQVELLSCKYLNEKDPYNNYKNSVNCFQKAIILKPNFINYSSGGPESSLTEYTLLRYLTEHGTIIVTSAGNAGLDLSINGNNFYPAKYLLDNLISVGNLYYNKPSKDSNYGLPNMVWERGTDILSTLPNNQYGHMSGTSQAAATHTNKLLKKRCLEVK